MMQENYIEVPKIARYITSGQPTEELRQIIYIFHGYGQLASSILSEFSEVAHVSRYLIAPEGLSRFYLSRSSEKVGASWMTREEREHEIADYLRYLDLLYAQINQELYINNHESILFGYSQGVATVCRWLERLKIKADRLILWAGIIPPEVELWRIKAQYPHLEVLLVAGTKDPLLRSEVLQEQENRLEKADLNYRKIRFDGGHKIDDQTLKMII